MKNEIITSFIESSRSLSARQNSEAVPKGALAHGQELTSGVSSSRGGEQKIAPHITSSDNSSLAELTLHIPQPPNRKGPVRINRERLRIWLHGKLSSILIKRAKMADCDPRAYAIEMLVKGLCLPVNEYALGYNRALKEAFIKNAIALNRIADQLARLDSSLYNLKGCPITRAEIASMVKDHAEACRLFLELRDL